MFRSIRFNYFQVIFKRYYSTALLRYGYCKPANIYLFRVNVVLVFLLFEHISPPFLVFLLLTLNKLMLPGNILLDIFRTETCFLQETEMGRTSHVPKFLKNPPLFLELYEWNKPFLTHQYDFSFFSSAKSS